MESVGAEHEDIAREHLMLLDVDVHEELGAERSAQEVAGFGFGRFGRGQHAKTHLLVDDRVVAGQEGLLVTPNQIAARVAHMGDRRAIVAKAAGHERSCHARAASASRVPCVDHAGIGSFE